MDAVPHTVREAAAVSLSPLIDDTVAHKAGYLPKFLCGWSKGSGLAKAAGSKLVLSCPPPGGGYGVSPDVSLGLVGIDVC